MQLAVLLGVCMAVSGASPDLGVSTVNVQFAQQCTCMSHVHTATAQDVNHIILKPVVCTAMAQTAGWAYTSVQVTPLQDIGVEKKKGWRLLQGGFIL